MKRTGIFILFIIISFNSLPGQSFELGIQYSPLQVSMISFDQDYVIYNDYTSQKIFEPAFRGSLPSLSNAGLFLRYIHGKIKFQTGLNFQNNVYSYGERTTIDYLTTFASIFYSSIDIPVTAAYTFRSEEIVKFRIIAGINNKMFKLRRNYYSVFARNFDYINYAEGYAEEREIRKFMVDKVSPFIVYFRTGIGIEYYNFTADIYLDRNLSEMNRTIDNYNANYKNSSQINLALGFSIAPKDLIIKKSGKRISKE